jgi:trehalose 6-phosphate phosphatase
MKNATTIDDLSPRADWALFLDVDGTLIDLAESPSAVVVPEGLADALARAAGSLGGALALVSGRTVADIDALFRPLRLSVAGVHGLELRFEGGAPRLAVPPMTSAQRRALASAADGLHGVLVEDKLVAIAFHYRAAPSAGEILERRIRTALAAGELANFDLRRGKMTWEVRPAGFDKGTAVEALMASPPFAGRVPVFVGDDETDLDGFAGARRLGGLAFAVDGAAGTSGFAEPAEVRSWLAALPSRPR